MTKQEKDLKEWLNGYKKRIDRYNEQERVAKRDRKLLKGSMSTF